MKALLNAKHKSFLNFNENLTKETLQNIIFFCVNMVKSIKI